MSNTELIIGLGGALVTLLLAGNIYFIKRLIDSIDKTDKTATAALRLAEAQSKDKTVDKALSEIKGELKELRRLEIDVAVMKSSINLRMGARNMSEKISEAS